MSTFKYYTFCDDCFSSVEGKEAYEMDECANCGSEKISQKELKITKFNNKEELDLYRKKRDEGPDRPLGEREL
jgi:rRNA maturation endonuclease Nob1